MHDSKESDTDRHGGRPIAGLGSSLSAAAPVLAADATMSNGVTEYRVNRHGGRPVARLGFGLGTAASLLANVLAQRIPPSHAPQSWHVNGQAEIGATLWPIFLLVTMEILVRARRGSRKLRRWAVLAGVVAVLIVSAFISYSHILAVLESWGYSDLNAHLGPLAIDGLMTVSGLALLDIAQYVPSTLGAPAVIPDAMAAPVSEQVGATRVNTPSPRVAPITIPPPLSAPVVTAPLAPEASPVVVPVKPIAPTRPAKREVVDISEGVDRRSRMFAYLDEHPDTTGADLDREFGTSNYGRGVVRAWKAERQQVAIASGE